MRGLGDVARPPILSAWASFMPVQRTLALTISELSQHASNFASVEFKTVIGRMIEMPDGSAALGVCSSPASMASKTSPSKPLESPAKMAGAYALWRALHCPQGVPLATSRQLLSFGSEGIASVPNTSGHPPVPVWQQAGPPQTQTTDFGPGYVSVCAAVHPSPVDTKCPHSECSSTNGLGLQEEGSKKVAEDDVIVDVTQLHSGCPKHHGRSRGGFPGVAALSASDLAAQALDQAALENSELEAKL
jgi:hypothetical protein